MENIMEVLADLHLHSRFSSSTSSRSTIENLVAAAKRKGLTMIGSGDCLHPEVLKELKELPSHGGLLLKDAIHIVLQCEIEDINRAHHLIFFPSVAAVEDFRKTIEQNSSDMDVEGRPTVNLFGHELAEKVHACGGIIGPAHYFTPYTGALSHYGSLKTCYQDQEPKIGFIELGLSADTPMANPMAELRELNFLSNSDAHSPDTRRVGREINLIELEEMTFANLTNALARDSMSVEKDAVIGNFGLPPQEGRYHLTGCSGCHEKYTWEDARIIRMRCSCGGIIKTGVKDIAAKHYTLGDDELPVRPPYRYILPLTDVIAEVYGAQPNSNRSMEIYDKILEIVKDELSLFISDEHHGIMKEEFPGIAAAVNNLRANSFEATPGGGGEYGTIKLLPDNEKREWIVDSLQENRADEDRNQKTLFEF